MELRPRGLPRAHRVSGELGKTRLVEEERDGFVRRVRNEGRGDGPTLGAQCHDFDSAAAASAAAEPAPWSVVAPGVLTVPATALVAVVLLTLPPDVLT